MFDINVISNILLVDDDKTSIFLQTHLLTDVCKYEGNIEVCYNGKTALDFIKGQGEVHSNGGDLILPELILLDINMPIMNGFQFLENYGQLDAKLRGGIVISMLTSSLNSLDKEKAEAFMEVSDFITKPLEKEALLEIVEKHFGDANKTDS
jgi:CheY-like chemotaxis protein